LCEEKKKLHASRGVLQYAPTIIDYSSPISSGTGFVRTDILENYKN